MPRARRVHVGHGACASPPAVERAPSRCGAGPFGEPILALPSEADDGHPNRPTRPTRRAPSCRMVRCDARLAAGAIERSRRADDGCATGATRLSADGHRVRALLRAPRVARHRRARPRARAWSTSRPCATASRPGCAGASTTRSSASGTRPARGTRRGARSTAMAPRRWSSVTRCSTFASRRSVPMRPGGDVPAAIRLEPGGQGANVAVRLARRGLAVSPCLRPRPTTRPGRMLRAALGADGVELRRPLAAERTGTVVVAPRCRGERTMLSQRVPLSAASSSRPRSPRPSRVAGRLRLRAARGRSAPACRLSGRLRRSTMVLGCSLAARAGAALDRCCGVASGRHLAVVNEAEAWR